MVREIDPVMHMSPSEGMRRFRIEDAIDDVLIAEVEGAPDISPEETTLQQLCRELKIEYTDAMRAQEEELQRLAELGKASARLMMLRNTIERYYQTPAAFRSH